MAMTKDDWKYIQDNWGNLYRSIRMVIDGYDITLQSTITNMRIKVMVFVNGVFHGSDILKDSEGNYNEIAKRFYQEHKSPLITQKDLKLRVRVWGKKHHLSQQVYHSYVSPLYTSFPAFKKQIINNNKNIQLTKE